MVVADNPAFVLVERQLLLEATQSAKCEINIRNNSENTTGWP